MSKWNVVTLGGVCSKGSSDIAQKDIKNNNGLYGIYGAGGYIKDVDFYHQDKPYIAVVKDDAGIGRVMLLPEKTSVIGTMQYLIPNELVITEYLYYAVTYMNLAKYFTGTTIPHIYFKDYQKEKLILPPIEIQKQIASNFDKVTNIINLCNVILEKMDLLIKSRFVEMFGELGTDKFGWGLEKIGNVSEINPKKAKDNLLYSDLEVSFVPMTAVSEKGDIDTSEIKKYDEVKKGFTYFAENDILFAKITPCMENGKGCIAHNLYNGIGFGSTEFHVLRPSEKINSYWLYTITTFKQFRENACANMTGSAGQKRVPAKFLENYKIAVPPLELQQKFADFVEHTEKSKLSVKKILEKAEILKKSLMQKYFG